MESKILAVFDRIKKYTLKSIENTRKSGKIHDPWNDTGMGYDIGWISNELGRAQMFLVEAYPELRSYTVCGLEEPYGLTTQDIFQQLKDADPDYLSKLFKVFKYFDENNITWCMNNLTENGKIEIVRNLKI